MVAVGELLAAAALKAVFGKLDSLAFNATWNEISLQLNFSKDLKSIKGNLSYIESFLKDAQRQSSKLDSVRLTLKKLKAAAYDLEDMLLLFEYWTTTAHEGESLRKAKKGLLLSFERLKMPHKIKTMRETIEEILDLHNKFKFATHPTDDEEVIKNNRKTTSFNTEITVGRINEKESITSLLLTDDEPSIVTIYGIGGVGKTTLAQMVYSDDRTKDFFDVQAWVYVSVKFDLISIVTSIISQSQLDNSSGSTNNNGSDLQSVLKNLSAIINNKRLLLVLDDIWEENPLKLEKIMLLFKVCKKGSKILITTRLQTIANLLNESSVIKLDVLSHDYCWELFRAKALPPGSVDKDKEKIGSAIVEKCNGIPLAVKSLGYLCRRRTTNQWETIRDSHIWAEDGDDGRLFKDTQVLPSLKLSYQYMPYYLKSCFAYCSSFPKGCHIEKSSLIQQWIALGFVQLTDGSFTAQQAGERYFEELLCMSFLQDVAQTSPTLFARYNNPQGVLFQMNGLVHELARLVAGEEVVSFDANRQQNLIAGEEVISFDANTDNCRYMLISNILGSSTDLSIPSTARALHFNKCSIGQTSLKFLVKAEFLRVLDLSACTISDLPDSIGKLKLLKFLNISGMQTALLPKSLSSLHGLQALNLSENTCLEKLPSYISEFVNLQYLDLHGCSNLQELPQGIDKLKELLHLNVSRCSSLQSLPEEFRKLQKLVFLDISYCSQLQTLPSKIGGLQSLSFLNLSHCHKLHGLPDSFIDLANMTHLNMSFCHQLKLLPSGLFKYMENLRVLNLSSCTSLEVLPEFCNMGTGCRKLEILELSDCTNLAGLPESCTSVWEELRYLNLSGCSRIQNFLNLIPRCKLGRKLEYLNLSRVGAKTYPEAPGTSARNAENSEDHSKELELGMLQEDTITQHFVHLRYLSVGGFTLFSEQGIARLVDLLTLPNFDVRKQPSDKDSNIMLLQQILDLTQHELNIKCLENVVSPDEAKGLKLSRKQQLHFLSLEWSYSWHDPATAKEVLEHLRPHQNLQCLSIKGYNGEIFPKWIKQLSDTLPNLVKLVFSEVTSDHIPTLGHLPNLQELEINNMPLLHHVEIVSCKKLRKLTLVKLRDNTIIHIFYDDNTQVQVNEVGLIHLSDEEEIETGKEIEKLPSSLPVNKQVKKKAAPANFLVNAKRFLKAPRHSMSRETKRTQDIGSANDSSAVTSRPALTPGPSNEERREQPAVPELDYLKIESCEQLKLVPYVPVCKEYFIKDSSLSLGFDVHGMVHRTPTFKSKICINNMRSLEDFAQWTKVTNINMDELIIIGMLDYYSGEKIEKLVQEEMEGHGFLSRGYGYGEEFGTCKWEFGSGSLRKLKITDCESSLIRLLLLLFTSLQELELDGLKTIDNDMKSTLCKMTRLEKLTIPSLELAPEEGKTDYTFNLIQELSDHIPYVNIREAIWFSVPATNKCSSSKIAVLFESYYPEIKRLGIKNLANVKGPEEVGEGDICRHYHELKSLSLMWSSSENSDPTVQDDPRIANDVAVLEKVRPPPCLSTLRLEGYWLSAVCSWMMNLSSVLPNLVRIELAMCEQFPPLGQLEHLNILTISHCCNLVTLPQIIRDCRSLKELEISECWNLAELPEWLGEITCLRTLIIPAVKLERLPGSIQCLTSLKKLVLKKCNNKLREWCNQNSDIIQHVANNGCLDISEEPDFFISSSCITLLQKTSSPHLHELNIKDLQCVSSSSEAKKIELMSKEELQSLSLEWSSYKRLSKLDTAVLEELQPHPNLERLHIKNYCGGKFPNWMHLCNNLVRLELSNCQIGFLCLDHLQNLEDLCISSFQILDFLCEEYPTLSIYNGVLPRNIVSTRTLKNLRKITIGGVRNLVWETSTSSNSTSSESSLSTTDNLFPGLEYLEINSCSDLTFKPSIPRSARYQISGIKIEPELFQWPSFQRVMGLPTSASSSKMVIKHSKNISSGPLDSLEQLDIEELTVDNCIDPVPLPECIRGWKSLRKIEILNCEDMKELPECLGDMASLHELKVETNWMINLPPCIERLTSLQTLVLSKCTKRFKQRCSEGGDDWSKINHIENLIVEERKP